MPNSLLACLSTAQEPFGFPRIQRVQCGYHRGSEINSVEDSGPGRFRECQRSRLQVAGSWEAGEEPRQEEWIPRLWSCPRWDGSGHGKHLLTVDLGGIER